MKTMECHHCHRQGVRERVLSNAGYCDYCVWMTTAETMRSLVSDPTTMRRWVAKGVLVSIKIVNRRLYHRADVEALKIKRLVRYPLLSRYMSQSQVCPASDAQSSY